MKLIFCFIMLMICNTSHAIEPSFIGKETSNSLYYLGARYYSSSLGSFISTDDMKAIASGYSYTHGTPIMEYDPTGLAPVEKEVADVLDLAPPSPSDSDDEYIYEDVVPLKPSSVSAKRIRRKAKLDQAIILEDRKYPEPPNMFYTDEPIHIDKISNDQIRLLQRKFSEQLMVDRRYDQFKERVIKKMNFKDRYEPKTKEKGDKSSNNVRDTAGYRCCEEPSIPALRSMTDKYRFSKNYQEINIDE